LEWKDVKPEETDAKGGRTETEREATEMAGERKDVKAE
jgi:hypothetical protein